MSLLRALPFGQFHIGTGAAVLFQQTSTVNCLFPYKRTLDLSEALHFTDSWEPVAEVFQHLIADWDGDLH